MPTYDDERGRNPVLLRRAGVRPRRRGDGRSRARPGAGGPPRDGRRGAGRGREPRRGHPGRPRPRHRGVVGRSASARTASRSSASARCPTGRTSMRLSTRCSGPTRPRRRSRPGRPPRARPVGRHVARRRRGRRPLRAADRPRARPVGRFGGGPRRVALDARGAARDRRGLRDRERQDRPRAVAAGRPERGRRLRGRRRAHRARRLRHRGDRAVHRRARGGGQPDLRRRPHAARARVGGRSILAAGARRGTGRAAGPAGPPRAARGTRSPAEGHHGQRRRAPVRDARRPGGVRPAPALDRSGRTEGGPVPGGARRADGPGRRRMGDQGARPSDVGVVTWTPGPPVAR